MRIRKIQLLKVTLTIAILVIVYDIVSLRGLGSQENSLSNALFRRLKTRVVEIENDRETENRASLIDSDGTDEKPDVDEAEKVDGIQIETNKVTQDIVRPSEIPIPPNTHYHNILEEHGKIKWPEKLKWVKIDGDIRIYVLAAFYDDRETLEDHYHEAYVRVIVISEVKDIKMMCHLHHDNHVAEVKAELVPTSVINRFIFENKYFRSNIYSCKVTKKNFHNKSPKFVSLVGPWQKNPSTFIPVENPAYRKPLYDFCVCQRHFGSLDPHLIVENFELHKMFGVSKMFIYTTDLDRAPAAVLEHYLKEGLIDVFEVPAMFKNYPPLHYRPNHIRILQPPTYNHCIYKNIRQCKLIIINDPDEIIVPRQAPDYTTMLQNIDRHHNVVADDKPSYQFRNVFFYNHLPQNETESSYVKSLRYQARMNVGYPDDSVKSFLRPSSCVGYHVHFCWRQTKKSSIKVEVDPEFGLNYHYRACHKIWEKTKSGNRCEKFKKEYLIDTHMMRYKDRILSAMKEKCHKIGLPLP